MILSKILAFCLVCAVAASAQLDFLLDAAKDGIKQGVADGTRDVIVGGVNSMVNGNADNSQNQAPSTYATDPQLAQQNEETRAELAALRQELAAMRQQQVQQQNDAQKQAERDKLKRIAELPLDPFDPASPMPVSMPDL